MAFDDLVLKTQHTIDRFVRRFRRGAAPVATHRRLLIIQIDGLSRTVLERGLGSGHMPFLRRLLRRGYRLEPMSVGIPTSTPAFQMAAMYGVRPDIPGFHYYDRARQSDIHFPRRGHAAYVEARQASGRQGILRGGSAYGCVFTGGADNNLFTFSSLTRPSGRGLLAALSPFVVLTWVCLKGLLRTAVELFKAVPRFVSGRGNRARGHRWLLIKIGISVWVREFFTMAVCRDLYAGTRAVYVNYLDYDEAAHAFGPRSRAALISLRRVDAAIRQICRVLRRVPEHRYDLYILADHGQAPCKSYPDLTGGRRFEKWIFEEFLNHRSEDSIGKPAPNLGLMHGIRSRRRDTAGVFQQYLNYTDEEFFQHGDPEAHEENGVRVIAAGPNAFLYILDSKAALDVDAFEQRFPGLAEKLSQSPGVGFVLARSRQGPICFWRGKRYLFGESSPAPFADRPDASLVVQGITDLMAMPSAGDLVIYGIDAPEGHISFLHEVGAHAGHSSDELHTFIIRPRGVKLPSPITHPIQLYDYFMRYQAALVSNRP